MLQKPQPQPQPQKLQKPQKPQKEKLGTMNTIKQSNYETMAQDSGLDKKEHNDVEVHSIEHDKYT